MNTHINFSDNNHSIICFSFFCSMCARLFVALPEWAGFHFGGFFHSAQFYCVSFASLLFFCLIALSLFLLRLCSFSSPLLALSIYLCTIFHSAAPEFKVANIWTDVYIIYMYVYIRLVVYCFVVLSYFIFVSCFSSVIFSHHIEILIYRHVSV